MKAVSAVLDSAVKAGVSDAVMAQMVSMAAGLFRLMPPGGFRCRQELWNQGYGSQCAQYRICRRSVQPKPYASVSPICAAVTRALGHSPVAMTVPSIAVEVAAKTPDNPLQGLTPGEDASAGALVMPGGIPVGGTPTSPAPVSNPSGN